jgi:hypothetical protein
MAGNPNRPQENVRAEFDPDPSEARATRELRVCLGRSASRTGGDVQVAINAIRAPAQPKLRALKLETKLEQWRG